MNSAVWANEPSGERAWLFGRNVDLWVFGGSFAAALILVALGHATGLDQGDAPEIVWLLAVLGVDVSHVWSTVYRTYLDPEDRRRRQLLYLSVPVLAYAIGFAIHLVGGPALFWRVLAYVAVFHFVRQQYGWVALYRRRSGENGRWGRWVDAAAIYASTLGPLVYWHASPVRHFHWFVSGDFLQRDLPWIRQVALSLEALALGAYVLRAGWQARNGGPCSWGKHLVVFSTAVCWYLGIVRYDSDYVFTVTNVLIHGIPYLALTFRYGANRSKSLRQGLLAAFFRIGWPAAYLCVVGIAFVEEGLWHTLVWHDHPQIFGDLSLQLAPWALSLVVPLLGLPQTVHYVLDGFVWKVGRRNPTLSETLQLGQAVV